MKNGIKVVDSSPSVTRGSRADLYWQKNGMEAYFKKLRPGMKLPEGFHTNDPGVLISKFNLKGIGFGNWTTIEDRINYLYTLVYGFYDLNKVLGFGYNMGYGQLGVTFGARGHGRALAHYEPGTHIINLTRYESGPGSKMVRMMATGGLGSFAHEYGHFLDYFAGSSLAPAQIYSLTNGDSLGRGRSNEILKNPHPLRVACDDLMEAIIWKTPGDQMSRFYNRLVETVDSGPKGEYWLRRNEIFARCFEVYIMHQLKKNNIKNYLLTKMKYNPAVYPTSAEMERIAPYFDKLIKEFKKAVEKAPAA